jgi:hypothetical protein
MKTWYIRIQKSERENGKVKIISIGVGSIPSLETFQSINQPTRGGEDYFQIESRGRGEAVDGKRSLRRMAFDTGPAPRGDLIQGCGAPYQE